MDSLHLVTPPSPASPLADGPTSPLAAPASLPIIEITATAHAKLLELRAEEADADKLGLRLEIEGESGDSYRYDLSFDEYTKAAFTDEVRTHDGLKVIIPGHDVDKLQSAVLDYADSTGLVIRNPNKPMTQRMAGLDEGACVCREGTGVNASRVLDRGRIAGENPCIPADVALTCPFGNGHSPASLGG